METMTKAKLEVQLSGENGNVFNLLGICTNALKRAGQREEAVELRGKVMSASSYDEALQIMMQYCEVN